MAEIYGSHFEFAGISSRQYNLIIASLENERFTQVAGTISGVTIYNKSNKRRYFIDDDYSDAPLSFEVEILTDDAVGIPLDDRRAIEKWLFNRHDYRKFYLDITDDDYGETFEVINGEQKRLYLNCRFINPSRMEYNGGIIGYRATLEADSGLWWQDEIVRTYSFSNAISTTVNQIVVPVDTDLDDYTYPTVVVTMNSAGGGLIMFNNTDAEERYTQFTDLPSSAVVTLNGEKKIVSGSYYSKFKSQNFPRLVDGDNTISIKGAVASVVFKYSNRRML